GRRDARPRRGLWHGRDPADARRAPRGRPAAPSQRRRGGAPGGRRARPDPQRRRRAAACDARRPRVRRGGALRLDARGGAPHLVGYLLDLGAPRGSLGDAARHRRHRSLCVRNGTAVAPPGEQHRQTRPLGSGGGPASGDRIDQRAERVARIDLAARLEWGLIPAVPVPFRGKVLAEDAQRAYAQWMADQAVAGVAVWAHTGRGPHLSVEQRGTVLAAWRAA